jgi:hypothetical protein
LQNLLYKTLAANVQTLQGLIYSIALRPMHLDAFIQMAARIHASPYRINFVSDLFDIFYIPFHRWNTPMLGKHFEAFL